MKRLLDVTRVLLLAVNSMPASFWHAPESASQAANVALETFVATEYDAAVIRSLMSFNPVQFPDCAHAPVASPPVL